MSIPPILLFPGGRAKTPTPSPSGPTVVQYPSPNHWGGRPYGPPIALVLHTEGGSEIGTRAWFANPASQVSAHFGVGLDGQLDQFVQLGDRTWANGVLEKDNRWGEVYHGTYDGTAENPNNWVVSIETEDAGNPAQIVTDEQYLGTHAATRLALVTYPSIRWLLGHSVVSPHSRPNCCGARWVASGRFAQLATDLGLRTLL